MVAEQRHTMRPTRPAQSEDRSLSAPTRGERHITRVEAPSSQLTERAPSLPGINGKVDPTILAREEKAEAVKSTFSDVFRVSNNCSEISRETLDNFSDQVSVAGRLSRPSSIEFFKSIGASEFLLNVLKNGHHSKFNSEVPEMLRKNNGSFYKHIEFGMSEVNNLLATNRIEIVSVKPHCVLPLHVVVQPKKNRLILDCTDLNKYIDVPKIKFDDYKCALNFFHERGYLICFDFKDGYYHVAIAPEFRKYLGFSVVLGGKKVFCQFKVGFLGLCDMPWLFTKIFRCLVKHWRSRNMQVCLYLDDGWCFNSDPGVLLAQSYHIRSDLFQAGVVWSIKKCIWVPTSQLEWLGMVWNATDNSLTITDRRLQKLVTLASKISSDGSCSVRLLASFVGQVISLAPVMGDATSLFSRFSQMAIANSTSYEQTILLNDCVQSELKFWQENVHKINRRSCRDLHPPSTIVLSGDASASGCGSFIEGTDLVAARLFSGEERLAHSTWRELESIHFALKAFKDHIAQRSVKFRVDNQATVSIVAKGSMRPSCHQFAIEIFKFCQSNGVSLNIQWVPRELNKQADLISRLPEVLDTDDWNISPEFFRILERRWGSFTVDCFANSYNTKCSKFYSLFLVPGTAGVDAFTFNWEGEFCLLVPPVAVVGRCLQHLVKCRASGVLVVPVWQSAYFWPLLCDVFSQFVRDSLIVSGKTVLRLGHNPNSLLGSPDFKSNMAALLFDCSSTGN